MLTNDSQPVGFSPRHSDEVCRPGRENLRVDRQSVDVMVPGGEGEEHAGPQGLVVEPGRVLVDLGVGAQQYRHPLGEARLLGADAHILN